MSRFLKTMIRISFLMIITISIVFMNPYYILQEETREDYRTYRYHKDIWDAKNEIIDEKNEWIRRCKDGERSCNEQDRQDPYIENLPSSLYLDPWMEERPLVFLTIILWFLVSVLIWIIYDIVSPKIYTVNDQKDLTYQGRMKYVCKDLNQRRAYFMGDPGKLSAWMRMYKMPDIHSGNIITNRGVIRISHDCDYVHRFKPHQNYFEIWVKQLEWGNDGLLYPGEITWEKMDVDTTEIQKVIDDELQDTEQMVRSGIRTNHGIRQKKYTDEKEDGRNIADEVILDSKEYDRRLEYAEL